MDYDSGSAESVLADVNSFLTSLEDSLPNSFKNANNSLDNLHEKTKEYYTTDYLTDYSGEWIDELQSAIDTFSEGIKKLSDVNATASDQNDTNIDALDTTEANTTITGEPSGSEDAEVEDLILDDSNNTVNGEASSTEKAEVEELYYVKTEKSNLNVRTESGEIIESIPKGTNVKVIGETNEKGYVKVEYGDGKTGYVYRDLIDKVDNSEDVLSDVGTADSGKMPESQTIKTGVVSTNNKGLNLRTTPDSDSNNIVGSLPKGTELNIIGESDDGKWYKILYNDKELFVFKEWVGGVESE